MRFILTCFLSLSILSVTAQDIDSAKIEKNEKTFGIGVRGFNSFAEHNIYEVGFEVYNWTGKTVKYVWLTIQANNAVDDPILKKRVEAIGPIRPKSVSGYVFKKLFYSEIIETIEVTKIEYQLMDGTRKSISGKALSEMIML